MSEELEVELVLKEVETGKIVGYSAPFWPTTRVIKAIKKPEGWEEVS